MARSDIDKARVRNRLAIRREPYWGAPIERGLYLGFRKTRHGGTWIARQRDDNGRQRYASLGPIDHLQHDEAAKAARAWARELAAGVDRQDIATIADLCRAYVADRHREAGIANASDAEGRFRRTVYGAPIGSLKLSRIRAWHIKEWRAALSMSDASRNRTLCALKAALNFAVASRYVDAALAIEWQSVKHLAITSRRELYLDREQRRRLVEHLPEHCRPFVRLLSLLPLRPGALAMVTTGHLDLARGLLRIANDKAGAGRVIALSPEAVALFRQESRGKLPSAPLVAYADGSAWHKERWKRPIAKAARAAVLPDGTCAYTLRHSVITDMLTGGMDSLTVARMAGTSLAMIEKHYGHLLHHHAARALAALAL